MLANICSRSFNIATESTNFILVFLHIRIYAYTVHTQGTEALYSRTRLVIFT